MALTAFATQLRQPRTLERVLLDIAVADQRWRECWNSDLESARLDELVAFKLEARRMIEAATGVSWRQIEDANL